MYLRTYEAPARQALDVALALPFSKVVDALGQVAARYALTRSGRRALEELAARLSDGAQFEAAALALRRRLALPFDEGDADPARVFAQAAVLQLWAGYENQGRRFLQTIEGPYAEHAIPLRGTASLGAELRERPLVRELTVRAQDLSRPPSTWPSVLGSFSHGQNHVKTPPPLGAMARWIHWLREPTAAAPGTPRTTTSSGVSPVLQLVTHESSVFLRRDSELIALDLETGQRRWLADLGPRPVPTGVTRSYVNQAAGTDLGGHTLALYRSPASAFGSPRTLVIVVDHTSDLRFERSGRPVYTPNRLCAYDAASGKLRWTLGGKSKDARGDPTRGLSFTAPPTAAGTRLVAPATRDSGFYLVGISPRGEALWVRRLYSFSPPYYQRYGGRLLQGSSVAVLEGVAYAAPGHGLVAAVEVPTGKLLWMSRYRGRPGRSYGAAWLHTHPMVVQGDSSDVVVLAPPDSEHLTALDPKSGQLIWDQKLSPNTASAYGRQIVGADRETVYVHDGRVRAISVGSGETVWESEELGRPTGHGFLADKLLYVPGGDGRITTIDTAKGRTVQKVRLQDPRLRSQEAFNLFPVDGQLIAAGPSRVFSLVPLEESWQLLSAIPEGELLFQRARLLRSEGKFREALDILYRLLERHKKGSLREKLVKDVVAVVREAVSESEDPSFIVELLERKDPVVEKPSARLYWRLWRADLLLKKDPLAAARVFFDLLGEYGRMVSSPEGNTVDVGLYASDVLRRRLRSAPQSAGSDAPGRDEGGAAPVATEDFATLESAETKVRELLSQELEPSDLRRIVLRYSHTEAAAEASARLAALARVRGDLRASLAHLELLRADYPILRGVEEIRDEIEKLRASPATVDVLRGLTSGGAGTEPAAGPWRQSFWLSPDEGFLVEAAPGSERLPFVLAINGPNLVVYDTRGKTVLQRPLPEYPDLEELKLQLQSHVEEPGAVSLRDGNAVVFTAAGCYAFSCGENAALEPASFKLSWVQSYPHGLKRYLGRSSRINIFGGVAVSGTSNTFPHAWFTPEGNPVLLHPDGTLELIDRKTGKYLWRQTDIPCAIAGRPELKGEWITAWSSTPPGLVRYRLPSGDGAPLRSGPELYPGPPSQRTNTATYYRRSSVPVTRGWIVEGLATVYQVSGLEVRALKSASSLDAPPGRPLWKRSTSSGVVRVTPWAVWTSSYGTLKARALRSGNVVEEIELPESSRVVAVFEDPVADRGGVTLVTTRAASYATAYYPYGYSSPQTGDTLFFVHLVENQQTGRLEKAWESKIASGNTSYDGRRFTLEDGRWLLTYNVQEGETEKWYTRVVAVDPESGEVEGWIEAEISGKGTGQPPRLCPVAGGLALGNSDGFGWYTRGPLPAGEEDSDSIHADQIDGPPDATSDAR